MHQSWFAAAAFVLMGLQHAPVTCVPESALPPSRDTSVVRVIAEAVVSTMSWRIAKAAVDTQSRVWNIVVPGGSDSVAWARLQAHLLVALRARTGRPNEADHSVLAVSKVTVLGDTLSAELDLTESVHCSNGGWVDHPMFYDIRAIRLDGIWGAARVKQTYDGHFYCPEGRAGV